MTEIESNTDAETAKGKAPKRAPGASFPSMSLSEAVTLIKKVASYGNTHTTAAVASFLGHQTSNSGPYRTKLAALKDYGLLSGRGDDLTVTPLALELVHPGLDADPKSSLSRAFRSCKLFASVYDGLPKDRDLEVVALANSALHNHGVATQAKDAFASSFVKSGETAGLLVLVDGGKIRLLDEAAEGPSDSVNPDSGGAHASRIPKGSVTPALPPVPESAVVNHSWQITGGTIRFIVESSRPLPATAYSMIGSVIEAGDKLAAMLGPAEVASDDGGYPE